MDYPPRVYDCEPARKLVEQYPGIPLLGRAGVPPRIPEKFREQTLQPPTRGGNAPMSAQPPPWCGNAPLAATAVAPKTPTAATSAVPKTSTPKGKSANESSIAFERWPKRGHIVPTYAAATSALNDGHGYSRTIVDSGRKRPEVTKRLRDVSTTSTTSTTTTNRSQGQNVCLMSKVTITFYGTCQSGRTSGAVPAAAPTITTPTAIYKSKGMCGYASNDSARFVGSLHWSWSWSNPVNAHTEPVRSRSYSGHIHKNNYKWTIVFYT